MRATRRLYSELRTALAARSKSTSFIGLGRMGSEMAFNLFSKQFALASDARFVACDVVPGNALRFTKNFARQFPGAQIAIAATPQEAALASETIVTMLPSSPQVKSAYDEGIIPVLRSLPPKFAQDTLCIDSTTLDVTVARDVASRVNEAKAMIVDAPVSGGVTGAKAGALAFLVGGTEEAFKLSEPFLSMMGQRIIHCGPSGAGLTAKICNNLMLGIQQIAAAEAMLLGQRLGLDPRVLTSVIGSSTGACWSVAVNNPVPGALPEKSPPCEREYEGGFAMSLMLKDMGLATDSAALVQSPLPLGEVAAELYGRIIERQPELASKDFSSVYRYLQERADTDASGKGEGDGTGSR